MIEEEKIVLPADVCDQLFDRWKLNEISFNEMLTAAAQWGYTKRLLQEDYFLMQIVPPPEFND